MTKQSILMGIAWLCLLCGATKAGAAEFTYRGVKFGMTRDEVAKLVPLEQGSNVAAGPKDVADNMVAFQFDDKRQLYAVEISYFIPKPVDIMRPALGRALQKKYAVSNPAEGVWDLGEARMTFEEVRISNRTFLRTTITHKRLYDEYLDRLGALLGDRLTD